MDVLVIVLKSSIVFYVNVDVSLFSHFVLIHLVLHRLHVSPSALVFYVTVYYFQLSQTVARPTHYSHTGVSSTIDLDFVSHPANVISCSTVSPLPTSDRRWILVSYKIPSSANKQPLSEKGKFGVTHSREQMRCSIGLTAWKHIIDETSAGGTGKVPSSMLSLFVIQERPYLTRNISHGLTLGQLSTGIRIFSKHLQADQQSS